MTLLNTKSSQQMSCNITLHKMTYEANTSFCHFTQHSQLTAETLQ